MDKIVIGILIPFIGTTFGSLIAFFIKDNLNLKIKKILLGFASGIMVAASIWSLIIPAIEQCESLGWFSWFPASFGLFLGFLFLILINCINKFISKNKNKPNLKIKKKSLMVFSIIIHNIPEGMAVGVAMAAAYYGNSLLTMTMAIALSVGVAVQNIPEGAIVAIDLKMKGLSKTKSFLCGVLSGVVEPIFSIITFFITGIVSLVMPYILSFAAGCMLFVVISEIIPEATEDLGTNFCSVGFVLGFIIMMILDVSLG